ncbi:MAG TPA: DoxX family protein [Bacteroidales bacterium]|nr:DoxX family protein [Bacteroidales bacterium]
MERFVKYLFHFCRISIGLLFIFSSFTKGLDPWGFAYKLTDYFQVININNLHYSTLALSFIASGLEFLLGVMLLFNVLMKYTAWAAAAFMAFFTVLTFLLAWFNPVSDCGCFGDAIKLTNWETFFKNVVFSVLVAVIFWKRNKYKVSKNTYLTYGLITSGIGVFVLFSVASYRHLPIIDFMPYSIGSNIKEKMTVPPGAPVDKYETMLTYQNKKTGEKKDFDLKNYPWQDSLTWKWVETKSVLVEKGYTPPIHDFVISDHEGNDITQQILNDSGYVFLFISYNLKLANAAALKNADSLYLYYSGKPDTRFYAVTASTVGVQSQIKDSLGLNMAFNTGDETMLKTVIRSNPGLVLLKNGTVLGKWHYNDIICQDFFQHPDLLAYSVHKLNRGNEVMFTALIFAFLSILILFLYYYNKK